MPENPDPTPADLHERFAEENRHIDLAYANGTLHEWIAGKLADERAAAALDD